MLASLAGTIQEQYSISIGYSNPAIPAPLDYETDFIICENEESKALKCFYKDDVSVQPMGPYLCRVIAEYPEHDDKVQGLFNRLNEDLMSGIIAFDPGVTRTEGDVTVQVTKKRFPGIDEDLFDTNIPSSIGTIYPYFLISANAERSARFALAKKVIDEVWPRKQKPAPQQQPQPQPESRALDLFDLLRRFFT